MIYGTTDIGGVNSGRTRLFDSTGTPGILNDLWRFSRGKWDWVGGTNLANQLGKYGTKGRPGRNNVPGARSFAVTWTDAKGDLWLFGGLGNAPDIAGEQ